MTSLTTNQGTASDYRLAAAVVEAMWLIRGDFELRRRWQDFTEMNVIRGWAFGMPFADVQLSETFYSGVSEDAVREAIFGSKKWQRRNAVEGRELLGLRHGLLDRNPIEELLKANAAAIEALREIDPEFMKDFGKWVAVDSLRLRASAEQRQSVSRGDEELLNRYLGCDMGSHGDKHWRGWMMLTLIDLSTGIPIAWLLLKASENEAPRLRELLLLAYRLLPWLEIEAVTGDKAFDSEEAYRLTERDFGIHLIADLSANVSPKEEHHPHEATDGCPLHSTGCGKPMRLVQWTFYDGGPRRTPLLKRRALDRLDGKERPGRAWFERRDDVIVVHDPAGAEHSFSVEATVTQRNDSGVVAVLEPGQDVGPLIDCGLLEPEHLRWGCDCDPDANFRTYPQDDWRLHTWAPRRDVHSHGRSDRYLLRQKLGSMHKSRIEGYHGELRLRGIGLDGADAPRTPNTANAVRWLHFGRAYRITMRTLVLRDGAYQRSRETADELGLLRPPDMRDLDYTRGRAVEAASADADADAEATGLPGTEAETRGDGTDPPDVDEA